MIIGLGGRRVHVIMATNTMDDSESLEFRAIDENSEDSASGRFLAGLTCYDRPQSPLLVYVPEEIESSLLMEFLNYARDWFSVNLPDTEILE
jgi:hypothetical protein